MASTKEMQQETVSSVDTAKAMIDKVLVIMQLIEQSPTLSTTFATNPIGFIMWLLDHLGVTYEELREFLTNFLVYVLPSLEISIKAILLTNLKNMLSCTADPRIPEKYRKIHKVVDDYNTSQERGIDINLESIDYFGKLGVSPLSKEGKEMYFGLEGIKDVYKFARAEDFDAFLWFVIHKGKFPNSSKVYTKQGTENISLEKYFQQEFNATSVNGKTLLEAVDVNFTGNTKSKILQGNTFSYKDEGNASPYSSGGHVLSMCIDSQYGKDNKIEKNTIVPISDDWNSVNWYVRRANDLLKNNGIGKGATRDYNKERAICNLQYIDQASSDAPITGLVNNKIRFTILPRPLVHIPNISEGEPAWRFKRITFDSYGNYDPNGKYTILAQDSTDLTYGDGAVTIDPKSGVITTDIDKLKPILIECYNGLTVYEFNYDYVMGMKLFDAKVIATTLLDSLINIRLGINPSIGIQHQQGTEEIREIIKNIINTDDSVVNDCFFEFDNSKYDALLRRAEEKRAKKRDFTDIRSILDEYDDKAELNVQVDVLNRAITQASLSVSDGANEKDRMAIRINFVTDLIEQLTLCLVQALLSPKVLMLLEVNETIMGGKWQKFTMKDLIMAMRQIIVSIVKEVRDLIVQELMKLLLKQLSPIIAMMANILVREQLENYTEAINDIIRNCPTIWFRFGNMDNETKLDTVDYADIDTSVTRASEQPIINC